MTDADLVARLYGVDTGRIVMIVDYGPNRWPSVWVMVGE